jgi:hypothetical protein
VTRRSVWAVIAGVLVGGGANLLASILLWICVPSAFGPTGRVDDTGVLALATAYGLLFGVCGFYVTARLAPRRPRVHVAILALLGLILGAAGSILLWKMAPPWYHWLNLAQIPPAAWLGLRWYEARLRRRTAQN